MAIIFDTSVWVRHFRAPEEALVRALEDGTALIHEAIIGELAVGRIPKPKTTIPDLMRLSFAPNVPFKELLIFIERRGLISKGLSWVDIQILGSALAAEVDLFTFDLPLAAAWRKLRSASSSL